MTEEILAQAIAYHKERELLLSALRTINGVKPYDLFATRIADHIAVSMAAKLKAELQTQVDNVNAAIAALP